MKNIKLLIMDVDGTLTDGKIYISNSGEEMKAFNAKDGYAIKHILPQLKVLPVILTGRNSKIVEIRSKELNIKDVYQGYESKLEAYEIIKKKYNVIDEEIAFIGDDFNDFILFNKCGLTACPADSTETVKRYSHIVLQKNGGEGAVQEFILKIYERFMEKSYTGIPM